jgi:hypothetical protein
MLLSCTVPGTQPTNQLYSVPYSLDRYVDYIMTFDYLNDDDLDVSTDDFLSTERTLAYTNLCPPC